MTRSGRLAALALAATALALAYLVQGPSSPALAHYVLVKSLAQGTAVIDETRAETGDQRTYDVSYFDGHYYANKAPGLAFLVLPVYLAVNTLGVSTTGDPLGILWALSVVGATLPAMLLLALVRWVGEVLEPGYGTAAAVTLGLGTLLAPFGTVLFPHVLSALLVFSVFVLLYSERRGQPRLGLVAAAGLLAGYAIATEYHNVFAVGVLGIYAIARARWPVRALTYSGGVGVGVMPLFLYNWWAFGSPFHLSYIGSVVEAGKSGHDTTLDVAHAVGLPDLISVASLLLWNWGLLGTSPVLAMGVAGMALLYRRGGRAEALTFAAVSLCYLLYTAAFLDPFGAVPPGPRYALPLLPFVACPLALAFRAWPLVTGVLAGASLAVTAVVTVTRPHLAWDGDLLFRLGHPSWWSPTVADLVGITGPARIVPLIVAFPLAVAAAHLATPRLQATPREIVAAVAAFAGWIACAVLGAQLLDDARFLDRGDVPRAIAMLAIAGCLGVVVAAILARHKPPPPVSTSPG